MTSISLMRVEIINIRFSEHQAGFYRTKVNFYLKVLINTRRLSYICTCNIQVPLTFNLHHQDLEQLESNIYLNTWRSFRCCMGSCLRHIAYINVSDSKKRNDMLWNSSFEDHNTRYNGCSWRTRICQLWRLQRTVKSVIHLTVIQGFMNQLITAL